MRAGEGPAGDGTEARMDIVVAEPQLPVPVVVDVREAQELQRFVLRRAQEPEAHRRVVRQLFRDAPRHVVQAGREVAEPALVCVQRQLRALEPGPVPDVVQRRPGRPPGERLRDQLDAVERDARLRELVVSRRRRERPERHDALHVQEVQLLQVVRVRRGAELMVDGQLLRRRGRARLRAARE